MITQLHPLAPYPSPLQCEELLDKLAENSGVSIIEYGKSVEGRALKAVSIQSYNDGTPRVLCTANIHGIEFISSQVAISLIKALCSGDPVFKKLRERSEIWIIPCLNPDGYARTWDRQGKGKIAELRTNSNGVDLNRNFPLPMGKLKSFLPGAGSSRPGRITYRGEKPFSEPETLLLDKFIKPKKFHANASLHSFTGTVIPARVKDRKSFNCYRNLAKKIKEAQPYYGYRCLSNRIFDVFTGELDDHMHHVHRCWSVCIESMTLFECIKQNLRPERLFWFYNPREPERWINNELPGLCSYFLSALEMERPDIHFK